VSVKWVDHVHCSTPHVAALALQALMAPLANTLASFPGPDQLFIVCRVWSCGVKVSSVHCLTSQSSCSNSAKPQRQLTLIHRSSRSSHSSSSWQIKLEQPARNLHARNLHARNCTHGPETVHMCPHGTRIYHRTCFNLNQ